MIACWKNVCVLFNYISIVLLFLQPKAINQAPFRYFDTSFKAKQISSTFPRRIAKFLYYNYYNF